MAKTKAGIVVIDDTKLQRLLQNLSANSEATKFFIRGGMKKAAGIVKPVMVSDANAVYPTVPGIRMTRGAGKSKPYRVWGRIGRAIRLGRFVPKRKDDGDVSQRIVIGAKLRGTVVGAPHANITRYSKNTNRKTKKGYNRGKFAAMPFVFKTIASVQGSVFKGFQLEYKKYLKKVKRGK